MDSQTKPETNPETKPERSWFVRLFSKTSKEKLDTVIEENTNKEQIKVYYQELIRYMKASQKVVVETYNDDTNPELRVFMIYSLEESPMLKKWKENRMDNPMEITIVFHKRLHGTFYETCVFYGSKYYYHNGYSFREKFNQWMTYVLSDTHRRIRNVENRNVYYNAYKKDPKQPDKCQELCQPRYLMNQWMWDKLLEDVPPEDPDTLKKKLNVLYTEILSVREKGKCTFIVKREDLHAFYVINDIYGYTVHFNTTKDDDFDITVSWG